MNGKGLCIYIAGPMANIPNSNTENFMWAEEHLQKHGWSTINPATKKIEEDEDWINHPDRDNNQTFRRLVLDLDTSLICKHADAIYMLRGWHNSGGAKAELALAKALGLDVYYE